MSLKGEKCVMRPYVPLEFVGWDFQDFSVCCKNEWFARLIGLLGNTISRRKEQENDRGEREIETNRPLYLGIFVKLPLLKIAQFYLLLCNSI